MASVRRADDGADHPRVIEARDSLAAVGAEAAEAALSRLLLQNIRPRRSRLRFKPSRGRSPAVSSGGPSTPHRVSRLGSVIDAGASHEPGNTDSRRALQTRDANQKWLTSVY